VKNYVSGISIPDKPNIRLEKGGNAKEKGMRTYR
jgi:hypothetical protein